MRDGRCRRLWLQQLREGRQIHWLDQVCIEARGLRPVKVFLLPVSRQRYESSAAVKW